MEVHTMIRKIAFSAALILALCMAAFAADPTGTWKATFDTPIGTQNYTYDFKVSGDKLTGTAKSDNGTSELKDGKFTGDTLSFVENLKFQDMEIRIEYTGKISGDEIKFTRKVGDFGSEELVAKRVK
jgi:opacity protein-like surface antigen